MNVAKLLPLRDRLIEQVSHSSPLSRALFLPLFLFLSVSRSLSAAIMTVSIQVFDIKQGPEDSHAKITMRLLLVDSADGASENISEQAPAQQADHALPQAETATSLAARRSSLRRNSQDESASATTSPGFGVQSYTDPPPPLKYDTCQPAAVAPHEYERRVQVTIVEAHHVPATHRYGRQAAPFVSVNFQPSPSAKTQAVRTECMPGSLAPRYGKTFVFGFDPSQQSKATLCVSLEDRHATILDETMGQSAQVPIQLLADKQVPRLEGWLDVSTHNVIDKSLLGPAAALTHSSHTSQVRVVMILLPPIADAPNSATATIYDPTQQATDPQAPPAKPHILPPTQVDAPGDGGAIHDVDDVVSDVSPGTVGITFRDSVCNIAGKRCFSVLIS